MAGFFDNFASKNYLSTNGEFLQSNAIAAKFVFLIFVLIGFFIVLGLGINAISYFLQAPTDLVLINGMITGDNNMIIQQDPSNAESKTIYRSNNQKTGVEFTWNAWLNITNLGTNTKYQHIFSKGGNGTFDSNGIMNVNNAPGVYIDTKNSSLHIVMDYIGNNVTQTGPQSIEITEIPLNKWFNLAVRMENMVMDIYINGTIAGRVVLPNIPKQNYENVFICNNGGFSGYISNLRYLAHAANVGEIQKIVNAGPNTTIISGQSGGKLNTDYLSSTWYSSKLV
jgi:hypothetical protein